MIYGERIRFFRKQKGLSQLELAWQLHISPAAISKIETNRTILSVEMLTKIAELLKVPPLAIMDGNQVHHNPNFSPLMNSEYVIESENDYNKMEFIKIIINTKDAKISTLKQVIDNMQKVILQQAEIIDNLTNKGRERELPGFD